MCAIRKLYRNCTEIVQKIYRKCAKICNNSNNEPVSTNELLQNLAHFLYIFCTISVQFPYGTHFLYVFCMFSVRSFFIGIYKIQYAVKSISSDLRLIIAWLDICQKLLIT